jgi:hypothetical protein
MSPIEIHTFSYGNITNSEIENMPPLKVKDKNTKQTRCQAIIA